MKAVALLALHSDGTSKNRAAEELSLTLNLPASIKDHHVSQHS